MRSVGLRAGAVLALVAFSTSAQSTPATTAGEVELRNGPGSRFSRLATIPDGDVVDVNGCRNDWCIIDWQGRQGYVYRQRLTGTVDVGPPLAPAARPGDFRANSPSLKE